MRIALPWFFCIAVLPCFLLPTSTLASGSKYHGTVLEKKAACTVIPMAKSPFGRWLSWQTAINLWNRDTGKEVTIGLFNCTMKDTHKYECGIRYINKNEFLLGVGFNGELAPGTEGAHKKLCNEAFSFLNKYLEFRDSDTHYFM